MNTIERIINFRKLAETMRDNSLKPIHKVLLVDLLLYAGKHGEAFPSHATLAKDMGFSPRYIRTCLNVLLRRNLLTWKKRGFSQSNSYEINEELYFHNDTSNRNYSSAQTGTSDPLQEGTIVQPNENKLNNSNSENVADKKFKIIFPDDFKPTSEVEVAVLEVWRKLEPDKPQTFYPTYICAARKGLPAHKFYEFRSEILQDPTIKNRGAMFNEKVEKYLRNKKKT